LAWPVTLLPSGFATVAEMMAAPGPVVTNDPVAWSTILATDELLESQTAGAMI